jgi:dynein heavy chain
MCFHIHLIFTGPLEKLKTLDKKILERDDTRDVMKLYTVLVGILTDYDKENITAWGLSIEVTSQAKLKNPLLRRYSEDEFCMSPRNSQLNSQKNDLGLEKNQTFNLLSVNFDIILIKLLREVKYFVLLGLQVYM